MIVTLAALAPWLVPRRPYDDVYPCFFCVSGRVYVLAESVSRRVFPLLAAVVPERYIGTVAVVYLPGFFLIILGGLQWYLLAVAVVMIRTAVERPAVATGLCPACGYDLRATPDRCPECGAAPPQPPPRPAAAAPPAEPARPGGAGG